MKSKPEKLGKAFDLLHDYAGGTFALSKSGDLKYGESWTATFYVGYGRHQHTATASDPATAIAQAAAKIPNAPQKDVAACLE